MSFFNSIEEHCLYFSHASQCWALDAEEGISPVSSLLYKISDECIMDHCQIDC